MKPFKLTNTAYMYVYVAFLSLIISIPASGQDIVTLTYSERYGYKNEKPVILPMLDKVQRSNKYSSAIVLTNENLDEETKKVVDYVFSVWESNILNCESIFIDIRYDNIEEDIRTTVQYFQMPGNIYVPLPLKYYLESFGKRDNTTPDGIITINSNVDWDYGLGDNIVSDKPNLAYGIMRAVGRILGFGSSVSVTSTGDFVCGCRKGYSVFDGLISNSNGVKLTSISYSGNRNPAMKEFLNANGSEFFIKTSGNQYKFMSPPYSLTNPPLVFLEDEMSLMGGVLNTGSHILQVDGITKDILKEIGWRLDESLPVRIVSQDIGDTGLASAYEPHAFSLDRGGQTITNPTWTLKLPKSDGSIETTILQDNGFTCSVPALSEIDSYKVNSDGDIEAKLYFSGILNGKEIKAVPFTIRLELKPLIEYAVIEKLEFNAAHDLYDAYYKVKYRGANRIEVSVEEEFGSILQVQDIWEPYVARGVTKTITAPFYVWIDFTARNDYGESVYTIELPPYGEGWTVLRNAQKYTTRHESKVDSINPDDMYEVYDINGNTKGVFAAPREIREMLPKGLYIIKRMRNGMTMEVKKEVV